MDNSGKLVGFESTSSYTKHLWTSRVQLINFARFEKSDLVHV